MVVAFLISSLSCVVFAEEGEEVATDAVKFYIASNDAKYVSKGVITEMGEDAGISENTSNTRRLLLRLDCTPFLGKTVSKISLNFWAERNYNGDTKFGAYKLNDGVWNNDQITLSSTYWSTSLKVESEQYTLTEGVFLPIQLDVTSIFNGATTITKENPYLNLMVRVPGNYNGNGTLIAGPAHSKYAPYFEISGISGDSTLYLDGGNGAEGTIDAVTGAKDATTPVPACTFTKTGYSFVKWVDTNGNEYQPNDTYTFTNLNDTLKAVWSYDALSVANLSVSSNDIKYVENEVPSDVPADFYLKTNSDSSKKMFVRLDCTNLLGKNIQNIVLKFYADRAYGGNAAFTINRLDKTVWQGDAFGTLSGTYWATGANNTVEKTYSNTEGSENYFNNGSYYLIELDVTTIYNNAGLTLESPYLNLMVRSSASANLGTKIAGLTDSTKAPYFEVVTKESSYFVNVDELGSEEVITTMDEAEACDEIVAKTSVSESSMLPFAAIYNTADDTLVDVIIGNANSANLTLSKSVYEGGDKYIKFFLFFNMDNIIPLIPAISLK